MKKPLSGQEIILKNDAYFTALLADIHQATQFINLEVYIFDPDFLGKKVADALINAAKRNVKVRVLVDGAGSLLWGGPMTERMEEAGIQTRVFHPLPWMIWHWGRAAHVPQSFIKKAIYLATKINYRNHRKTCVIDYRTAYVSSANICKSHVNKEAGGDDWRDTTVKLVNIDTAYLQYAFEIAWNHLPFKLRKKLKRAFPDSYFYLNYSWRQRRFFYYSLLEKLAQCQRRVWITNAYFVPDKFLLRQLIKAAKRGVEVKFILPHKSDVFITSLVTQTFYSTLMKNGIQIYEYLPSMVHAKILIIDDDYWVGSSNLNYRSLKHDLEVDVHLQTEHAQQEIEAQFFSDLSLTQAIDETIYNQQIWYKSLLGRLLLFIRYWI